ncbi:EF-P-5 aminopentanone reductase [Barrientosiimonas marina]
MIIGASGDIGQAVVTQLGREGHQLMLHYYQNKHFLDKGRTGLDEEAVLLTIQADLSKTEGISHLLRQLVFPVDAVVFAGGRAHYGLFQNTDETLMDAMLTLHVKTPWIITKNLLPSMIQQKQGRIILITSIWGEAGAGDEVIYSSVKGAQNSFVKALDKETAPSGIAVNAVSPGFIDTKMNASLLSEEKEEIIKDIPARRAGTPDDVAQMVRFLMREKSDYVHGEIINISGGWHL